MSWVREALAPCGSTCIAQCNDVAGGNRGYPTLIIYDYWNCTGAPALWCSWLPELLTALFEGGGSLLPAGLIICAISDDFVFQMAISISPPSFWMRTGRPACTCSRSQLPCFHTRCAPIPPRLSVPRCPFVVEHFELLASPTRG